MMRKQHKFQQNRQLLWEKLTRTKDKVWWQNMRKRGQNVSTQLHEVRKLEDEKRKQNPEYIKLMELKAKSKNRKKKKNRKKAVPQLQSESASKVEPEKSVAQTNNVENKETKELAIADKENKPLKNRKDPYLKIINRAFQRYRYEEQTDVLWSLFFYNIKYVVI